MTAVAARSEADAELAAMLLRVGKSMVVVVSPSPEHLRLDDWFLGARTNVPPRPVPVPFFPEVHEELTKMWRAPYTARLSLSSSLLTTLDACKLSLALAAKAYSSAGQDASVLHAMAILQVYQAKALKELHNGSSDPGLMQELRLVTNNLVQMADVDKVRFLDTPEPGWPLRHLVLGLLVAKGASLQLLHVLPVTIQEATRQPGRRTSCRKAAQPDAQVSTKRKTCKSAALGPVPERQQFPTRSLNSPPRDPVEKVSVAQGSPTLLQGAPLPELSPLPLPGCPTADGVTRLRNSVCEASAQVQGRPFHICPFHSVLHVEIAVLLAKDAIKPVPPTEMKSGFYSPYFIVPKKSGSGISVQTPPLCPVPVSPRLYQTCGGCPSPAFDVWLIIAFLRDLLCRHRDLRLLGHMAAETEGTPLGLLHMRLLQCWLHDRIPRWTWHCSTFQVGVTPECRHLFSPWSDPVFLRAGSFRLLDTNSVSRSTPFFSDAAGQTRASPHGQHSDRSVHQPPGRSTLPSHVATRPPSPPLEAPLSKDTLAHSWPRGLLKYAFPPVSLLAKTLCKIREDEEQVLLVAPYWPTQTWFVDLMLLATAPPCKIPLRKDLLSQGMGTICHLRPICGTFTCGFWMGRGRSFSGRNRHYYSGPLYEAGLCSKVGSVS
ncbi:Cytoplasmic polyadenylation element-binding protein [Labeo rohita]|uniref:Cytoplasmic polyadenylation element-binding protein n=1 Tax=Labeo rohita TaxID=84645 RepID=A0ABQ8L5C3_LABRO|nr:Cytoplasmic polyadenylation element-binding protein [Labeo rohita]